MKNICLLLFMIIILSACTLGGNDSVRESIPAIESTPSLTQPPTPTWTPSPVPSPTPAPQKFNTGQSVYLIPDLVKVVFGPFKLGRNIQFMKVTDLHCSDYETYQLSEEWVYHGQTGLITDFIVCGEATYYKVAVEKWIYSDVEYFWVMENQLSEDLPALNYPFVLSLASDCTEDNGFSPYIAHIFEEQVYQRDHAGNTTINNQQVFIKLKGVVEVNQEKSRFYRYVSTVFMVQNEGNEVVEFNTKDQINARANALGIIYNPTVILAQSDPADVSILPGELAEFEIVWRFTRTRYSDHDLALYISVNTPINDDLFVTVVKDSLFFRDELPLERQGD